MIPPRMPTDLDDALDAALGPGERLLWSDRPHGFLRVLLGNDRSTVIVFIVLGIMALSPLGILAGLARGAGPLGSKLKGVALIGAVTVPFGAALLALFLRRALLALGQRYALTDQDRLLFVTRGGVEVMDATGLGFLETEEGAAVGDVRENGQPLLVAVNDPAHVAALLRARSQRTTVVVPPFRLRAGERLLWSARPAGLRGLLAALGAEDDRGSTPGKALGFVVVTVAGAGLCVVFPVITILKQGFVARLASAPHGATIAQLALVLLPSSVVLASLTFMVRESWRWWRRSAWGITDQARLLVIDADGLQRAHALRPGEPATARRGWLSGCAQLSLVGDKPATFSLQGLSDPQAVARALDALD